MQAVATRVPTGAVAPDRPRPATRPSRLGSVDVLRGAVMVIMLLDHVRAYTTVARFDPTDLTQTTAALFLTRWITHFCAPTFVLLAGMSAWLAGRRRTRGELARFLVTRGLWLVALELTVVSFAWYFDLRFDRGAVAQVIWAIGVAMVVLGGMIHLPHAAVAAIAVALVAGHNLVDGIAPASLGAWAGLWTALHVPGPILDGTVFVLYPLAPWIGVLAAGYALGPLLAADAERRQRILRTLGWTLVIGFVLLRVTGVYGDPRPWTVQRDTVTTALAFLDTTKYPPSLEYLAMTLGPALLALAWLERLPNQGPRWLRTFGQVPLFFYVVHLYLVHAIGMAVGALQGFGPEDTARFMMDLPVGFGVELPAVYALWLGSIAALYPACRWYAERKRRGTAWWWSYV